MTKDILVVLGAADPEMNAIEKLVRAAGLRVEYAMADGRRVHPGNAYRAANAARAREVWLVECDVPREPPADSELYDSDEAALFAERTFRVLDHHRPGDPGFGAGPDEFLHASSLGQVIAVMADLDLLPGEWDSVGGDIGVPFEYLAGEDMEFSGGVPGWYVAGYDDLCDAPIATRVPDDLVITAAADHCLHHAYAGRCPGVHREDVRDHRVQVLAARRPNVVCGQCNHAYDCRGSEPGCVVCPQCGSAAHVVLHPARDVQRDLDRALLAIAHSNEAAIMIGGFSVTDFRGTDPDSHMAPWPPPPELPDAACYAGIAYLATPPVRPGGDQRRKVVLGGATTPELVESFMRDWAPANGITGIYGDPARGFAGGYVE